MQFIRLRSQAGAADPVLAVRLVEAIGADNFAARLLSAVAEWLPASHCTVFALCNNGRVESISTASGVGEVATLTAVEYMRMGFDRQDSNMVWLARRKPGKTRLLWMTHQFAEEVANEAYRRLCYGETGIRERLSLLAVQPDGVRVAVSFYRNHSYPDFRERDFEWTARQAPLLAAAALRQVQIGGRGRGGESLDRRLAATLSAREREVIAYVLAGMTTKEAAREMGVSATTALTYRYRAFQHLGVRTHRELLALAASGRRHP